MKKTVIFLLVLLLCCLPMTGCGKEDALALSQTQEQKIRQAFLDYTGFDDRYFQPPASVAEDLILSGSQETAIKQAYVQLAALDIPWFYIPHLHVVWHSDPLYALYFGSSNLQEEGSYSVALPTGQTYTLSGLPLYIYDGSSLRTLQEACTAGVVTDAHMQSLMKDNAYLSGPHGVSSAAPGIHAVWKSGDMYVLYIGSSDAWGGDPIRLTKTDNNGKYAGFYEIEIPQGQTLYIYSGGSIVSLEDAYKAGTVTPAQIDQMFRDKILFNNLF